MSISSDNSKVTAPISVNDVRYAIGEGSTDVGTLCASSKINKWAKYKPISYAKIGILTEAERREKTWGLTFPHKINNCAHLGEILSNFGTFWAYTHPSGTSSSPYRLTDFANSTDTAAVGYNHKTNPINFSIQGNYTAGSWGGEINIASDETGKIDFYWAQPTEDVGLTWYDVFGSADASNFYFCADVYRVSKSVIANSIPTITSTTPIATAKASTPMSTRIPDLSSCTCSYTIQSADINTGSDSTGLVALVGFKRYVSGTYTGEAYLLYGTPVYSYHVASHIDNVIEVTHYATYVGGSTSLTTGTWPITTNSSSNPLKVSTTDVIYFKLRVKSDPNASVTFGAGSIRLKIESTTTGQSATVVGKIGYNNGIYYDPPSYQNGSITIPQGTDQYYNFWVYFQPTPFSTVISGVTASSHKLYLTFEVYKGGWITFQSQSFYIN